MNFPSCIKIPPSKNPSPQSSDQNGIEKEVITYEELIKIANSCFGEGQWSHAITSQAVDFVEYVMGKYQVGCAAFVRVQLANATFHEAMGYGTVESSAKGSAIRNARSLSIAVALKKALLCFGGIVAEQLDEIISKAKRKKQDSVRAQENRVSERAAKMHEMAQDNSFARENKTKDTVVPCVEENSSKRTSSRSKNCATPIRNKSPKPVDANDEVPIDGAAESGQTECSVAANQCVVLNERETSAASTSEEDIRLERKRKQKQKQEEYKKLMMEKLLRVDEKPNPRF